MAALQPAATTQVAAKATTAAATKSSDDDSTERRLPRRQLRRPRRTRRRRRPARRLHDRAHHHEGELSHGREDHLVRRPVERPGHVGADPHDHRVGPAPGHACARQPAHTGVAAEPAPLPRRARAGVPRRARRRDPARQLHRLQRRERAGAVHVELGSPGRRVGHRRDVPPRRDRDHVTAAQPHVATGVACRASPRLLPLRHQHGAHADGRDRREGGRGVERRGARRHRGGVRIGCAVSVAA